MELRFHKVIAVPRGATKPEEIETLYEGTSAAGEARQTYEEVAADPGQAASYETIAIFEHCTPRAVYHPPLPPVKEPALPPKTAEVKPPAPETTLKPKPPPAPPHHETHSAKGSKSRW